MICFTVLMRYFFRFVGRCLRSWTRCTFGFHWLSCKLRIQIQHHNLLWPNSKVKNEKNWSQLFFHVLKDYKNSSRFTICVLHSRWIEEANKSFACNTETIMVQRSVSFLGRSGQRNSRFIWIEIFLPHTKTHLNCKTLHEITWNQMD